MKRRNFIKTSVIASSILAFPSWIIAKTGLPNVLILGDSISIGYTPFVQEMFNGEANVFRPLFENGRAENCQGTTNGVKNIDRWIGVKRWDVIHFNFGLHDLKHVDSVTKKNSNKKEDPPQADLKQYKKNLEEIVDKLKSTGAKLIFATTTPYPENPAGPFRGVSVPKKYNKVALKIMKKNKIVINDLYSYVLPRMEELQLANNVHFKKLGSEALGGQVAITVRKQILSN